MIGEIVGKYRLRDGAALEALTEALYAAIGRYTNTHQLAKAVQERLGVLPSDHTVAGHLAILEREGLFRKAVRYDIRGRKYFGSPFKYYAADTDALREQFGSGAEDRHRLQENLVFNALVARGYSVDIGVVELNRRDASGRQVQTHHEISFVARSGDRRTYVQLAQDLDRALIPLLNTGDFFRRIVLLDGAQPLRTDALGIEYIGLDAFLQRPGIL